MTCLFLRKAVLRKRPFTDNPLSFPTFMPWKNASAARRADPRLPSKALLRPVGPSCAWTLGA